MAFNDNLLEIDDKIKSAISFNPIKGVEEGSYKFIKAIFKGNNGVIFLQLGEKTVEIDGEIRKVYGLDDFSMQAYNRARNIKDNQISTNEIELKGKNFTIMIPPYEAIIKIAQTQIKTKKIMLAHTGDLLLGEIIAYLSWIPEMSNLYKMYKRSPDAGVEFVSNDVYVKYMKDKGLKKKAMIKNPCYTSEMICIGYVIILAMVKPIYNISNQSDQWLTYAKGILKDMNGHLGAEGSKIIYENILNRFVLNSVEELSQKIENFPEFKSLVFMLLLQSENPIMAHMKQQILEICMEMYTIIFQFITAPQLTEMHIDPRIYSDLIHCDDKLKELMSTYGDLWPFYKLLKPNGVIISKTFESAALAWHYSNSNNSGFFKNLPELKMNEEFVTLSRQPLLDKSNSLGIKFSLDSRVDKLMDIFNKRKTTNNSENSSPIPEEN